MEGAGNAAGRWRTGRGGRDTLSPRDAVVLHRRPPRVRQANHAAFTALLLYAHARAGAGERRVKRLTRIAMCRG